MADWNPQANDIFLKALDICSPQARLAFLDSECMGNAGLRAQVESLLTASDQAGSFLESPAPALGATINQTISEQPGTMIGPYKLLQQIGEGGMGVVYMAQQTEPVERRVALKIIKPGMDSRKVIARFEAERQALALMDHPNIAKVLDAGTTDSGRPYFVMELVKGVPITEYCDEKHLTVRQRLELLLPVCQAVQHAHQKGIIHRDIKPSNVMVALYDGRPVPKVIDFGVAKATGSRLTDKTVFTEFGQVVGTLEYMSPEQAELNQLDVDTRSDIYSLGVLLYELLTGTTPLERKRLCAAAFDEMLRMIREEEPPKPSTRLSTTNEVASIAANRGLEPKQLSGLMRGELDWIVMKTLEKDRSRRYETANGLAMDISRYLADETVQACPPSATYRFRKFARRNRVALTTVVLVSAALVLGTVVSTWQAVRATRAEHLAEANFQKARATVDEYFTLVSESKLLDVPGLQPLRLELLEAALRFYKQFAGERTSDPTTLADLAVTYLRVAEIYHATERNDDAIAAVGQALDVIDRLRRDYPSASQHQRRLAGFWKGWRLAQRDHRGGNTLDDQAAMKTLERLLNTWQRLVDENPSEIAFKADLSVIYTHLGELLSFPQPGQAVMFFEKAQRVLEPLVREHPRVPEYRADLARICGDLVGAFRRSGRESESQSAFRQSLTLSEGLAADFPKVSQYRVNVAIGLDQLAVRLKESDPKEAECAIRRGIDISESLVVESPGVRLYSQHFTGNLLTLTKILKKAGKQQEAAETIDRVIEFNEKLKSDHPNDLVYLTDLVPMYRDIAEMQTGQRRLQTIRNALAACRQVVDVAQAQSESPAALTASRALLGSFAHPMDGLAALLGGSLQYPGAVEVAEEFIEVSEKLANARSNGFDNFAHTCRWLSDTPGHQEEYLRKSIAAFERCIAEGPTIAAHRTFLADTLNGLGERLTARHEMGEAEICFRKARDVYGPLMAKSPGNREYCAGNKRTYANLIEVLLQQGKPVEAEETLHQAVKMFEELAAAHPTVPGLVRYRADSLHRLAQLQTSNKQVKEAKETDRQAIDAYNTIIAKFPQYNDLGLVYMSLAPLLASSNRSAEAKEIYRQVVALFEKLAADHPNEPNYRAEMGHSLWQVANLSSTLGQHDEAEKLHRRALDVFEKLAADVPTVTFYRQEQGFSYWHLGSLMKNTGRPQDAEEPMRQALAIHAKLAADFPNEHEYRARLARSYTNLIEVLLAQDKQAEAEKTIREAVDKFGELATAHPGVPDYQRSRAAFQCQLAQLQAAGKRGLEAEKSFLEAINSYEKIIKEFPQYEGLWQVYSDLAHALAASNRPREADATYRKVAKLAPTNAGTLNNLAWGFATSADLNARNASLAVELAKKAIELDPTNIFLPNTLGVAHYCEGNWQDAIEWLMKSMELRNGGDSNDWFFLAMAHQQLGHKEEARKWLDQAVDWMEKHAPQNEELLRFRAEAEDLLVGKPAVDAKSEIRE